LRARLALAALAGLLEEAVQVGLRSARHRQRPPLAGGPAGALLLPLLLGPAEDGAQKPHAQGDQRDDQDFPVHSSPPSFFLPLPFRGGGWGVGLLPHVPRSLRSPPTPAMALRICVSDWRFLSW